MRGKPLEQTQEVISDMLAVGFNRKEFSIRTQMNRAGGYERWPEIHLKCSIRRAMDLTPALMYKGYTVTWYWNNDKQEVTVVHVQPYHSRKEPRLEIIESWDRTRGAYWMKECERLEEELAKLKEKRGAEQEVANDNSSE